MYRHWTEQLQIIGMLLRYDTELSVLYFGNILFLLDFLGNLYYNKWEARGNLPAKYTKRSGQENEKITD